MSYTLRWDLYGPPIFSIGRIDIDSNRPSISSFASGRTPYYSMGVPEMMTISLKDCVTINASVLENLRSYMNIPFPLFYLVEENLKSVIKVGDAPVSTMRLTNFTITNGVRGGNTFSLELITGIPLQYIVCPEVKIDHMEIKVAVEEKIPSRQIVVCKK